ncbi:hypothetical protein [Haloplanus vescus]|uniref:hypothetical protein n=1 Tax=Haloplanus vescus TaxID=555874 RepID=UPI00115F9E79|nr:hypothetical protein [Haloplanus vescus]
MSIWRTKRRYEENRRFNERADTALLAIGMLRNEEEGLTVSWSEEELRSQLREGRKLLEEVRNALSDPESSEDYIYALSQRLCDHWRITPSKAEARLAENINILERASEELTAVEGLSEAEKTLFDIHEIAGQASESESEKFRDKLVN